MLCPTESENWGPGGFLFHACPSTHALGTTRGTAGDLGLGIKTIITIAQWHSLQSFFPTVCRGNNCIHYQGQWFGETWKIAATRNPLE